MTKPWEKYQSAGQNKPGPWAKYGTGQNSSAPADDNSPAAVRRKAMLENIARAKAGETQVSPESAGRHAYATAMAENAMNDTAFGAFLGNLAKGVTFGFNDEIAAGVGSLLENRSYDEILAGLRARDQQVSENNPKSALAGEIVGAVASPVSKIGAGWAATGGLLPRIVKGALVAGTQGAIYGFGAGEGGIDERATSAKDGAKWGALVGGAIPIVGSAIGAGLDRIAAGRQVAQAAKGAPTTEEVRAAGRAAYKAVDDAGVRVSPQAFSSAVSDITDALQQNGLKLGVGRELAPKSAAISEVMADVATDPKFASGVPFSEIDTIRKLAGAPASTIGNDLEQSLGVQVRNGLDDFVNGLTPEQVTSGSSVDFPALVAKARDTWATMRRSQTVDDAIAAGQEYVSGSASGIRNQFSRILKSPRLSAGFSDAEKAAMRRVATGGSIPEKLVHLAASGMGQMATVGGGAGLGGLHGAAMGAALASGTRRVSEALANRQAEIVRAMIANGGIPQAPQIGTEARKVIENLLRAGMVAGVQRR